MMEAAESRGVVDYLRIHHRFSLILSIARHAVKAVGGVGGRGDGVMKRVTSRVRDNVAEQLFDRQRLKTCSKVDAPVQIIRSPGYMIFTSGKACWSLVYSSNFEMTDVLLHRHKILPAAFLPLNPSNTRLRLSDICRRKQ